MTRKELLKNSMIRYTAEEIERAYFTRSEISKEMNQCEVCGCLYYKENGIEDYEDDSYSYGKTCLECVNLIKKGISFDDIPYRDEYYNARFI